MPHSTEPASDNDFDFPNLPPFPNDVPTAPLLRIELVKLLSGDEEEIDRLWDACCDLGFFYLYLVQPDNNNNNSQSSALINSAEADEIKVNGTQLLLDADELFKVAKQFYDLPVADKLKYDFKAKGSYFGYKGYGDGVIDKEGTSDRNEFYNIAKDDILGISAPLPAPALLQEHRPLLKSYIEQSHAIVTLILNLLNKRLQLPDGTISSRHRLQSVSGDQVRFVHAPPQPADDRRTALGEHTDFGSVTVLHNRLGGLQVRPPGGEWCYVKPLKEHAVVNLGDAMVRFTSNVLRSNVHRVVNPPGLQADSTRMSLVYFARPEDDVILKPLDGSPLIDAKRAVNGSDETETITAKEWILRRALQRRKGGDFSKSGGTESSVKT